MALTDPTVQRTVRAVGKGKKARDEKQPPAEADLPPTGVAPPPPEPPSTAPLPLGDLGADYLGVFFELCFPDKRLVNVCRELKLTTPGYRLEALPPDQVARVLADEYLAAEDVRPPLEAAVREALRWPAFEKEPLSSEGLDQLCALIYECMRGDPLQQLAAVAWRALLDTGDKRLTMAQIALEDGVKLLDAPQRPQGKQAAPDPTKKEARAALKQAERAGKDREQMKLQLAEARLAISERDLKLAEQNVEFRQLRAELARTSAELQRLNALGEGKALHEARRSADEARSLAEKLRAAQEALQLAEERAGAAERKFVTQPSQPAVQPPKEDELPSAEEAAEFLVPVLTREFYDSLERWDRRIKRATLEKILLLSQNWRHGSLRALQLEGVPGYYRIRIATDVRLIYRREGAQLEILSLIDREDLDRYIRQARTRQGEQRGKSEAPDAR